jgi:hypothetical protein
MEIEAPRGEPCSPRNVVDGGPFVSALVEEGEGSSLEAPALLEAPLLQWARRHRFANHE